MDYYLAILIRVIGRFDAPKLRLLFAVFPVTAVLSFYRIARRFTTHPLIVSSLFAASPAFFVLSPTLMMDIPMLAFLLAGLSVYLAALETGKRLWAASACFVFAAGAAYTAFIPLICLFLWIVVNRRPAREWIALAVAPVVIGIWLAILTVHFGKWPTTELFRYYTAHSSFGSLVLPMLSFVGGTAVFPWSVLAVVKAGRFRYVASSTIAALILSFSHDWPSTYDRLWFVVLASAGVSLLTVFALKSLAKTSLKPPVYGFLLIWLPAALVFLLFFADMMAARYILLALPPLLLVVFGEVSAGTGTCAVILTLILSFSLAIADYRMVNAYPQWVQQYVVPLQHDGFRVWNASESGLRFYLEEEGVDTLDQSDNRPKGSDLIVRQDSFTYSLSKDLEPLLITILRSDLTDRYPVRLFSHDARAGFHDSHFGLVPFVISREPLDHVTLAEVSPFVVNLPEEVPKDFSSVPVWFPGGVLLKQTEPDMTFRVPMPGNTNIQYELEGKGSVAVSDHEIHLKKEGAEPILWKNFRIVPNSLQ